MKPTEISIEACIAALKVAARNRDVVMNEEYAPADMSRNIDFIQDVITFNKEILGVSTREPGLLDFNEHTMTVQCLLEEIEEYQKAAQAKDLVGCIDALTDLAYFLYGALYKHGLTLSQIKWIGHAVHQANMTKKKGINAKRDLGASDAVKATDWVGPEKAIASILGV